MKKSEIKNDFYKTKVGNLFLKCFLNKLEFNKVISKSSFFRLAHLGENRYKAYLLVIWNIFATHDYCMVDYLNYGFGFRHSSYRIITEYKWRVAALSVKDL